MLPAAGPTRRAVDATQSRRPLLCSLYEKDAQDPRPPFSLRWTAPLPPATHSLCGGALVFSNLLNWLPSALYLYLRWLRNARSLRFFSFPGMCVIRPAHAGPGRMGTLSGVSACMQSPPLIYLFVLLACFFCLELLNGLWMCCRDLLVECSSLGEGFPCCWRGDEQGCFWIPFVAPHSLLCSDCVWPIGRPVQIHGLRFEW